ncbi:two component transcriptional regulator, LytTR family [Anaerovirgula multivorans]|uniref:Stage 0 sporulation protein A homolog n=1 Tax=Anaerovirgula multivorans TaxID=312168 RepID=A0A239KVB7_9FIRM|nr:LytTR family DNA-binding domain-containing protein [Anaerovirgula multivorans]SNT21950.1 two component transcriptional regulator, LytTR family [Anaerovirgula multivorans]
MANILICDDHKPIRKMLEKIASENPFVSKVFVAEDGVEAVKVVQQEKIDIALLDIDMPNLNGIDAAKLINKISPDTKFVFITAHMEYAIDSFAVHPYNYLIKPIDITTFKDTLDELIVLINIQFKQPIIDKLTIKNKNSILLISFDDILFFEKIGKDTIVNTCKEDYVTSMILKELESILNNNFLRVHQSFIVNTNKIKKIEDVGNRTYIIEFNNTKKTAFMSRNNYKKFTKYLKLK